MGLEIERETDKINIITSKSSTHKYITKNTYETKKISEIFLLKRNT